ncbi:HesA/MoeB/ThiF family protein [Flavobacterium coralii]|uniref:HesA/MoeB/ThiF family protein n=1 Tax=Flavobacterium coralii TaxID=2838017 RepID=UPI000C3CDA27|nr:thiamine biosynthesis protein ThiF [Flavobacterium sp.]|tara:strand:- start:15228 stop:15929 length:702 start_codon:yes stop_codon:yes gene_type:complete
MRYLQQTLVSEFSVGGQAMLNKAKVLIVGAGGLGTPVATYLAAMGIGTIGIADFDIIQETNLHRQFAFTPTDLGKRKTEVLSTMLRKQNPDIKVYCHEVALRSENAADILSKYDLICDCTDNVNTRILLDKTCNVLNKKLLYGAVRGWEGYVTVLHGKALIGLNDIFSESDLLFESQNNCSVSGVISTVCGIIGCHQANEAVKIILGVESNLDGAIFCYDGLSNTSRIFRLKK